MPDPTKRTVSATQVAALFNRSHWGTRFTLYHEFKGGLPDRDEDARMSWGKKLQPLVLQQAAKDLKLEVAPYSLYASRDRIGCTKDAVVFCPDRGAGALETKCVFDYQQWGRRWAMGKTVPFDYEAQLQAQMYVGDHTRDDGAYKWGVIAVWVCGEMHYFERTPDLEFWQVMEEQARAFLANVENGIEPEPAGEPLELPVMAAQWGTRKENPLFLDAFEDAKPVAEAARMYAWAKTQESFYRKLKEKTLAKVLVAAGDHDRIDLPGPTYVRVTRSPTEEKVITEDMVGTVARKAGVRTTVTVSVPADAEPTVEEEAFG